MRATTSLSATLVEEVVVGIKFDLNLTTVTSILLCAPAVVPTPGLLRRFDCVAFSRFRHGSARWTRAVGISFGCTR
jgi:hypothetical protein